MNKWQIKVNINGRAYSGDVEARKLLVDFIRDDLGLTGTHVGCEHGVCWLRSNPGIRPVRMGMVF